MEKEQVAQAEYLVIDVQTKAIVGTYKTAKRARRAADKLDLGYGAIRYYVKTRWQQVSSTEGSL